MKTHFNFFLPDVDFMRYYKLSLSRYSLLYIVSRCRTRQIIDLEGSQQKFYLILVLISSVFKGCSVSAPTFWHRSFGADLTAPRRFGTAVYVPVSFLRRCVFAPRQLGAEYFGAGRFGEVSYFLL